MKKFLYIVIIASFISCKSDRAKFIGHWHCIEDESERYSSTLDINDSLMIFDKMLYSSALKGHYDFYEDYIYYTDVGDPIHYIYKFSSDTLYLDEKRWVKVKHKKKEKNIDFFDWWKIEIQLDTTDKRVIDTMDETLGLIGFGKLKENTRSNSDSIYLQINSTIGGFDNLISFAGAISEVWDDDDSKHPILLCYNKTTPDWMVDSTRAILQKQAKIEKFLKIYIEKKTGNIGLIELK